MSLENPNLAFIACGNTQANQSKAEGKPVTLLREAKVMPSGVVPLNGAAEAGLRLHQALIFGTKRDAAAEAI